MKKRNNYFKVVCWVFVCVFILTGCSNNHGVEEKISVEDRKEEPVEEKNKEPEIESSSVLIEEDAEEQTVYNV